MTSTVFEAAGESDLYLSLTRLARRHGVEIHVRGEGGIIVFSPAPSESTNDCAVSAASSGARRESVSADLAAGRTVAVDALWDGVHFDGPAEAPAPATVRCFGWSLNRATRRLLTAQGAGLTLSPMEFTFADLLFQNSDRVVRRSHILSELKVLHGEGRSRALDTMISRLRSKLNDLAVAGRDGGDFIATVYGVGYTLRPS